MIAPPSIKPGAGEYKWLNDLPVADAPPWLIEAAREKPKPEKAKKPSSRASASDQAQATSFRSARGTSKQPCRCRSPRDRSSPNGNSEQRRRELARVEPDRDGGVRCDRWVGRRVCNVRQVVAEDPGYDADDTEGKWKALEKGPPTEISVGTIFYLADQASPTWRSEYRLSSMSDAIQADKPDKVE